MIIFKLFATYGKIKNTDVIKIIMKLMVKNKKINKHFPSYELKIALTNKPIQKIVGKKKKLL